MKHDRSSPSSLWWGQPAAPFSFLLDGTPSDMLLPSWKVTEEAEGIEGGTLRRRVFADPVSDLVVSAEIRSFEAFPAVEWVVYLENRGDEPTPIIENILPLDARLPVAPEAHLRLHHAKGSRCLRDDFRPLETELGQGFPPTFTVAPQGGRPSDGALPFMNLQTGQGGVVLALGWSGQWQASFAREEDHVRLTAGMERTHLRLPPGERIRTPRILLVTWEGTDPIVGSNRLRQLILAHYTPRPEGEIAIPPIAHNTMSSHHFDRQSLSLERELKAIGIGHELGLEAHWIDACWFATGRWSEEVGDWRVRREVFPDGLRPLGDATHRNGMKFIVWFEPERVCRNTPLALEHPDWMLDHEGAWSLLLNLGIPAARQHIVEMVSGYVTEFGIDVYRQDFNIPPLPFWRVADAPDRVGMTEIRHIEGLYELWDELRRRHPHLTIDNCASGGRRIDLETTSRSYPLWRSDFSDVGCLRFTPGARDIGAQCQTAGLSRWVPLHTAAVWTFAPYEFRSAMSSGVVLYSDIRAEDFPSDLARQAVAELKRLRPYFLGDFFPLLPLTTTPDQWCAYQYHRQDLDAGFALFLRRHESPRSVLSKPGLQAIDPDRHYRVGLAADYGDPPRQPISGRELLDVAITITEKPGSLLLLYAGEHKEDA